MGKYTLFYIIILDFIGFAWYCIKLKIDIANLKEKEKENYFSLLNMSAVPINEQFDCSVCQSIDEISNK